MREIHPSKLSKCLGCTKQFLSKWVGANMRYTTYCSAPCARKTFKPYKEKVIEQIKALDSVKQIRRKENFLDKLEEKRTNGKK